MGTIFDQEKAKEQEKKFRLIAGPCALENEEVARTVAAELARIQEAHEDLQVIFKASVDKANRSSFSSYRGAGFEAGLEILSRIRDEFGLALTTDFHQPEQAKLVGEVCDVVQVPAFLCRQTDMLAAAAKTGRIVSVKKGQFLSPWDMKLVVDKLEKFGAAEIWQLERGTSFGYGSLVVDMRSFQVMRENNWPVIYDLTHSLQLPGMGCETTGGAREFADTMARAAIGAGIDGIYLETHPDPEKALCDAMTQLPLSTVFTRLETYLTLWRAVRELGV